MKRIPKGSTWNEIRGILADMRRAQEARFGKYVVFKVGFGEYQVWHKGNIIRTISDCDAAAWFLLAD